MRLAVFIPNWVGDVVMATPAIRALRKYVGDGTLIGVMRPYVGQVLDGCNWFDETILYAKKTQDPELQWRSVRRRLRESNIDVAVLLTNSLRTGWMAYQSGARERVGAARNLRGPLLTTRVYEPRRGWRRLQPSTIDGYMQIALAAGCDWQLPSLELATTDADEAAADDAWRRLGLPNNEPVAVLNTGGAFGAAKDWPAEHFADLARRLAQQQNVSVLINCGPSERQAAANIATLANDPRVTSLASEPDLPIGLAKAVIRRASLLVTTDSGPRFFGVAFGVPVVTLFGPTSVRLTRTYSPKEVSVSLGLDCQPCMQRTCPLKHHQCMRDLSVDRVYAASLTAMLWSRRSAAAA